MNLPIGSSFSDYKTQRQLSVFCGIVSLCHISHQYRHVPFVQALIHGLNRHYYSITINYRKNELEQKVSQRSFSQHM